MTDGEGNRSYFAYDGHDRLAVQYYPSKTVPGDVNLNDFDYYIHDDRGNVVRKINRDNSNIYFTYDALGRVIQKDLPGTEPESIMPTTTSAG